MMLVFKGKKADDNCKAKEQPHPLISCHLVVL